LEEKDYIERLFADKLGNAETSVNPDLWSAISSKMATHQAGSSSALVSKGLSSAVKWMIGLGSAACVGTGVYFLVPEKDNPETKAVTTELVEEGKAPTIASEKSKAEKKTQGEETTIVFMPPIVKDLPIDEPEYLMEENISYVGTQNVGVVQENRNNKEGDKTGPNIVTPFLNSLESDGKPVYSNENENKTETQTISSFRVKNMTNVLVINSGVANNYFYIEMEGINEFVLNVMNERNQVVYSTSETNFKWDGRDSSGNFVPDGRYLYFFTGKDDQGNPITKSSTLDINPKR